MHRVCIYGNTRNCKEEVLVRIHSECWTGDCLGSSLCDCCKQLEEAKKQIIENSCGVIIFPANHEGRGIGLVNKLKSYNLQQNNGLDTYEANKELGFNKDLRTYNDIPYLLRSIGIKNIKLLTHPVDVPLISTMSISLNPDKINILKDKIDIITHVELTVPPSSDHVERYLKTKHKYFNDINENKVYKDLDILFVISEYYEDECRELMKRVKKEIKSQHLGNVTYHESVAPGTREIPWYTKQKLEKQKFDGVFAIGITLQGGTNHHDIIATTCTTGLMTLENKYNIPIPSSIISAANLDIVRERTQGSKCTAKSVAATLLQCINIKNV